MPQALVIDLARNAVMLALLLAGPFMIISLLVGIAVSLLQAITQIQEQTLTFVPKVLAVAAAFLIALPWIIEMMVKYTTDLFRSLPALAS